MSADTRLWENPHPYYAGDGYGSGNTFESFDELREHWNAMDGELNLLYRWDWYRPGVNDWDGPEELEVAFVLQRKGLVVTARCPISADQEADVRAWLIARSADLAAVWAPLTPTTEGDDRG
jgi:hypothetical protein